MALPAFLGPFTPVPAPPALPAHAFAAIGGGAAQRLTFTMQVQQQSQWCWAATSASIDDYYGPAGTKSQCAIATGVLGGSCCTAPGSPACNQPYYLDVALSWVGHLAQPCIGTAIDLVAGGPGPASLETEINGGRPVGCHISWSGGGGHFNVIYGYDTGTQDVDVADPYYSTHTLPYAAFKTGYQGAGTWDASYLTS